MNVIDVNPALCGIENLIHANHVLRLIHLRLENALFVQEQFQTTTLIKKITFVNNVLMAGSQWQIRTIVWNLLRIATMIYLNMRLFLMKKAKRFMNAQCVMMDISGAEMIENASHAITLMLIALNVQDMVKNVQLVIMI